MYCILVLQQRYKILKIICNKISEFFVSQMPFKVNFCLTKVKCRYL